MPMRVSFYCVGVRVCVTSEQGTNVFPASFLYPFLGGGLKQLLGMLQLKERQVTVHERVAFYLLMSFLLFPMRCRNKSFISTQIMAFFLRNYF